MPEQEELNARVLRVIAETMRKDPALVTENTPFEELGIDSMDAVNIVFSLESEFNINIPDEDVKAIRGIPDMIAGVRKLVEKPPAE